MKPWIPAGLAALALAVPAFAQQPAKPEPGCNTVYSDKKGDVANPSVDITGFWFDHVGGKTFANLRIADLKKEVPGNSTGVAWYVLWTFEETQYFVTASIERPSTEPEFGWGLVDGNLRDQQGETPGVFVTGPDGVIRMEIPAEAGAVAGKQLKATLADTSRLVGIPGVVSSIQAEDEAAGKAYTVAPCAAAPAPTPVPTPPPAPTPPPGQPAGDGRTVAEGKLDVAVAKRTPKAKRVRRSLPVKLTSRNGVSNLDAALYQGKIGSGKIVGKGKLAKIAKGKKGTLKLKLAKKLKKGGYTLYIVGKNADGTTADKTTTLKFR